jgi:hypothetical protein
VIGSRPASFQALFARERIVEAKKAPCAAKRSGIESGAKDDQLPETDSDLGVEDPVDVLAARELVAVNGRPQLAQRPKQPASAPGARLHIPHGEHCGRQPSAGQRDTTTQVKVQASPGTTLDDCGDDVGRISGHGQRRCRTSNTGLRQARQSNRCYDDPVGAKSAYEQSVLMDLLAVSAPSAQHKWRCGATREATPFANRIAAVARNRQRLQARPTP